VTTELLELLVVQSSSQITTKQNNIQFTAQHKVIQAVLQNACGQTKRVGTTTTYCSLYSVMPPEYAAATTLVSPVTWALGMPLLSVTHGQCDARPVRLPPQPQGVTPLALAGTKL